MKRVLTTYRRRYLYVRLVERRREIKRRAVEYKGGKCERCGYDRCAAAFDFHHPDPGAKEFGISAEGSGRSFEAMKPELDKTVMLCANCHREVHEEFNVAAIIAKRADLEREFKPRRGRPRKK